MIGKGLGLLFEQGGQHSFAQPLGGSLRCLLEAEQVVVATGSLVAEGPAGDNFAPLVGEIVEIVEFLRG